MKFPHSIDHEGSIGVGCSLATYRQHCYSSDETAIQRGWLQGDFIGVVTGDPYLFLADFL